MNGVDTTPLQLLAFVLYCIFLFIDKMWSVLAEQGRGNLRHDASGTEGADRTCVIHNKNIHHLQGWLRVIGVFKITFFYNYNMQ